MKNLIAVFGTFALVGFVVAAVLVIVAL